ncbi:hypothetical protein O6H91_06G037700 [Diphasiastrum complanatum]|uniref:Uncharacterized protein n=1 Tax=Diphasiastrum complanatum TaxID=34168 RepID=A0ACC2DCI6_DIPCM|nr:hypothetical protein O6H91_06G037700 [Diphasiastrum complanatum]
MQMPMYLQSTYALPCLISLGKASSLALLVTQHPRSHQQPHRLCNKKLLRYRGDARNVSTNWHGGCVRHPRVLHAMDCRAKSREAEQVKEEVGFPDEAVPSASGYLPVSDSSKSRLFYVYYEATNASTSLEDTPLMLWLNGGPGCSSLIGCFYELGPWRVQENCTLQPNPGAWNRRCGILFIDNPLGTGFSVASSDIDIPRDQQTVATHLQYSLGYFLSINPNFKKRRIFLAGESYAGKYVPALAYYMLENKQSQPKFNIASQLAGIAVGNGLTHPRTQVQLHADVSYNFGLLDKEQSLTTHEIASQIINLVDSNEWLQASERRNKLCSWIEETSGIATLLDVRRSSRYHHLRDTMKSAKWMVEAVLKRGIPVLLYQGQFDAKDGVAGSEAWMRALDWEHSKLFWTSNREIWKVNGKLAGYWRHCKNLTHVVNAGAGHQVPVDQPLHAQSMIEMWMDSSLKPSPL